MRSLFSRLSMIIALGVVASCSSPVKVPPTEFETADEGSVANIVSAFAQSRAFSGVVLVGEVDEILFHEAFNDDGLSYAGRVEQNSAFAVASLTKSFTSILALQLVEAGKLSLDDTLADYFPDYPAAYASDVTVRHLLQNRSGIPNYHELPGWFESDYKRSLTEEKLVSEVAKLPLKFRPGTDYLYSNANFYLAGMIIEHVSGLPFDEILADKVLKPSGMTESGQIYAIPAEVTLARNVMREDDGSYAHVPIANPTVFKAAGSLYSTAEDLYRWHLAMTDDTLLSEASKTTIYDPDASMAWTVGTVPLNEDKEIVVQTYNGELVGYTSIVTRFPEEDGVVVILNNNNVSYEALLGLTLDIATYLYGTAADQDVNARP